MACVLAISSQVARGHIGLSAIVPALQRLGHEVWPLPTILLSNHPGHPHAAGMRIAPAMIEEMVDALDRNGWLGEIDAVITGYLPSPEHVALAANVVRRLKSGRDVLYLCDPVLGDEPRGLYIEEHAAAAIRDALVPLADVITPNRFELEWLSGRTVSSLEALQTSARSLSSGTVLAKSAFRRGDMLDDILISPERSARCSVPFQHGVPHGTGDLLSGLFLGQRLSGKSDADAMAQAAASVEQVILASRGRDELVLVSSQEGWSTAAPLQVINL